MSDAQLPKAKPGEFLFGLDCSLMPAYLSPAELRYTELMGTDIIRGGVATWKDRIKTWDTQLATAAPLYRQSKLKLSYMFDPPDARVKDQASYSAAVLHHIDVIGEQYKDLTPYFELGNEPDIGFFQGPMQLYADGYLKFRNEIKHVMPDAIVMNGGWAYNGDRIAEFYNIVKPAEVDIIAYHGHGDVANGEELAHRRVQAIATKAGFGEKTMVDTETGIMAVSAPQEEIQARVCVEKLVYAQTIGAPFCNWFRLFFEHPDSYGCTIDKIQPRPSILSYRATVETLRGYRFKQSLALPYKDAECHLFEQIDGPGRACVMWVNGHDHHQAYLQITDSTAGSGSVSTSDIYGNRHQFELREGGIAALDISDDPTWLCFTQDKPFAVAVAPTLLETPSTAELHVNASSPLVVRVCNPLDKPVSARLDVRSHSDGSVSIAPESTELTLSPHEQKQIDLTATVGEVHEAITWPRQWTVFVRTSSAIDATSITTIPETLPGEDGPVKSTSQILRDGKIDLARLSNYVDGHQRVPAFVMGSIDSIDDRTVTVGAGSDFWMAWYLNGKVVFDDLAAGNGPGYTMLDHPFALHLNKARNLLVGKILSGNHGFVVAIGSPDELQKASGVATNNSLQFTYAYDGGKPIVQPISIDFLKPIELIGSLRFEGPPDAWEQTTPDIVLADRNVTNLHFKDPDSSLWWKGFSDLSATAWMRADKKNLYLLIKVIDDINRPAADPAQLVNSDSVALAFSPRGKNDITQYQIGAVAEHAVADHAVVAKCQAGGQIEVVPDGSDDIQATVTRVESSTYYRIRLSKHLTGNAYYLNFLINDNDAGIRKQLLEWKPGMESLTNPANWYRVTF